MCIHIQHRLFEVCEDAKAYYVVMEKAPARTAVPPHLSQGHPETKARLSFRGSFDIIIIIIIIIIPPVRCSRQGGRTELCSPNGQGCGRSGTFRFGLSRQ